MTAFRDLDRLLRGDPLDSLDRIGPVARTTLLLAASYGVGMGVYGLFRSDGPEYRQALASAMKVPALFALTLGVTFPSLYVFNTLFGTRAAFGDLFKLVAATGAVLVTVLAAFGPIVAFFSITTTSYPFVLLLNVAVYSLAGAFGVSFLFRALGSPPPLPASDPPEEGTRVVRATPVGPPPGTRVFALWVGVFGLVGAQMSWVLRPFIGDPNQEFTLFRARRSSFFEAVLNALVALVSP